MRTAALLILAAGCILPDTPLDGKACPCAAGFVCDDAIGICVRELAMRDAGLPPEDSGVHEDAAAPDAAEDSGVSPDVAPIPECARDTECMMGRICSAGACTDGCATKGCDPNETCDPSGHCFSNALACTRAEDCNPPDHVCVGSTCAPGCAVGMGSCAENQVCDLASGYCVAAPECSLIEPCPDRAFSCAEGLCLRSCDAPSAVPCLGGSTCNAIGRCTGVQLGDFCQDDGQCASGLCYSLNDPPAQFCTMACGRTADCPLSMSCLQGSGFRLCVPEDIFAQVSFATRSGGPCGNPGNTCQSGTCSVATMTCVEQCSRDAHCDAFATDCTTRQQTIQGRVEFLRECAPGPGAVAVGGACVSNADCASGICDRYRDVCALPCCTDGDCGAGESCLVYDLDARNAFNTCQPRGMGAGALGSACTMNDECESDVCTPASPANLAGAKICSIRCCTHADCDGAFAGPGYCHLIPGILPGTLASTCFPL